MMHGKDTKIVKSYTRQQDSFKKVHDHDIKGLKRSRFSEPNSQQLPRFLDEKKAKTVQVF